MPSISSPDLRVGRRLVVRAALAAPFIAAGRAAGAQPGAEAPASAPAGSLFVLNSLDANVQVLDPASSSDLRRVPVLR